MAEEQGQLDTRGAKAASRQSEEGLRQLLAATGQGIYGVDLQGNCTFVNPACVRVLGYESDQDLLGRNMHALIHHTRPNGEPYRVEECRIYQAFRGKRGQPPRRRGGVAGRRRLHPRGVLVLPDLLAGRARRLCRRLRRHQRTQAGGERPADERGEGPGAAQCHGRGHLRRRPGWELHLREPFLS